MSREGIFNRCQREPKERQETRTKRIREFDVEERRICFYIPPKTESRRLFRSDLWSLPAVFARVKSSRNRFRRFETSSRVNAFRVFALLEFVPISFPARAFASCTPARTLVVSFRARGKKTSGKTVLLLCCFRVWRERRAFTVPLCARHVDIIFPYEVEHIGNRTFFSTFVTHRNTHKHTYSSCKSS